jgi:hypothetical protein
MPAGPDRDLLEGEIRQQAAADQEFAAAVRDCLALYGLNVAP